jgi:CubicO group peptidase (beta-lactamase class C family)
MRHITRRWLLKRSLAAGLASVSPTTWAASQPATEEIRTRERVAMAGAANAFMKEYDVPGLAIAIGRKGRLVYAQGFGIADKHTGEKVTPTHLFRIASVSKPITSVAILSLLEQDRLTLADKVFGSGGILEADYPVPSMRFVSEITIDHLLTHTIGGWPNGRGDPMFSNYSMNHRELIGWTLENLPLAGSPGIKFAYSNFGYCLLGRIIEKITGQQYADYVRRSVLAPSGIAAMRIGGNALAQRVHDEVVYYAGTGNPYGTNVSRLDSTGGWLASATDLVHFAAHVDGFSQNILQPKTIAIMTTPSRVRPRYARGWGVIGQDWWHDGGLPGTTSIIARTNSGSYLAALANSNQRNSNAGMDRMARNVLRLVKHGSA